MRFVRRRAAAGERTVDPLSERLFDIGRACQNRAALDVPAFLELEQIFSTTLTRAAPFRDALARAYDGLANKEQGG